MSFQVFKDFSIFTYGWNIFLNFQQFQGFSFSNFSSHRKMMILEALKLIALFFYLHRIRQTQKESFFSIFAIRGKTCFSCCWFFQIKKKNTNASLWKNIQGFQETTRQCCGLDLGPGFIKLYLRHTVVALIYVEKGHGRRRRSRIPNPTPNPCNTQIHPKLKGVGLRERKYFSFWNKQIVAKMDQSPATWTISFDGRTKRVP